jgi:hypothetical protein
MWLLRDTTTPELEADMLAGLAYLRMECLMVRAGDYGADLFGGSRRHDKAPPRQRTPVWSRGRGAAGGRSSTGDGTSPAAHRSAAPRNEGPPSNFDVVLHLDFEDWAAYRRYSPDPAHQAASRFNGAVSWDELTARVDWHYDGDPPGRRGHVKHVAMFVWADGAGEQAKGRALDAVRRLADAPGVEAVTVGENVGQLVSDYDWIMDLELPDRRAAERLLSGAHYARAMDAVAAATKYEWTARLSHIMRGP